MLGGAAGKLCWSKSVDTRARGRSAVCANDDEREMIRIFRSLPADMQAVALRAAELLMRRRENDNRLT